MLAGAQRIEVQDLTNNNGYVTIKLGEVKLIKNYNKTIHIINTTEYENTKDIIKNNIEILKHKSGEIGPIYSTLVHSLQLLESKITNIKPHFKAKRGLINILGKGLKLLAGTMDSEDEKEITEKLEAISQNNKNLIYENNKQIQINEELSDSIKNVTLHIKKQQNLIEQFLNQYNKQMENKIINLEHKIYYMQQIYQINYDINLLLTHLDEIEQIIFTSKLGILTRNILTDKELKSIEDLETLQHIKISVAFWQDQILIIVFISNLFQINKISPYCSPEMKY